MNNHSLQYLVTNLAEILNGSDYQFHERFSEMCELTEELTDLLIHNRNLSQELNKIMIGAN